MMRIITLTDEGPVVAEKIYWIRVPGLLEFGLAAGRKESCDT